MGVDRSVLRNLSDARELFKQERYGEAGRFLGAILEAPEDYFVRAKDKGSALTSLKAEADNLLGQMPAKGREVYELQYGARARQLLNEAVTAGDIQKLVQVSRQFFRTQAGYQATLLQGLDELDHGRPLAAALTFQRLRDVGAEADAFEPLLSLSMAAGWLQAGLPDNARRTLAELRKRLPDQSVKVAGRDLSLADAADATRTLQQALGPLPSAVAREADGWMMFRGDAARNGASRGSAPLLNLRWRVPVTDDPVVEDFLEQRAHRYRDQGISPAPGLHPLAVGDTVLMRTVRNLLAVDFITGKRLWEVPTDDRADGLQGAGEVGGDPSLSSSPNQGMGMEQRVWDDQTYGTLSSDGQLVFSIEDLGWGAGVTLSRHVIINGRRQSDPTEPKPYNRLVAHDIRTGKLKWHLGGPSDRFALRQAEAFFLGSPLPLGGRLYVLAEVKEEVRLLVLDAATGDLLWSQQLAPADRGDRSDPLRRLAGISPSHADGILVCPTSAGVVVAVDASSRWLRWRFPYRADQNATALHNPAAVRFNMMRGGDPIERWLDSSTIVARGRVIFSPVEAEEIYCLNLIDGQLVWRQPRKGDLYLAAVDDDRVVIVGRHQVRAVRLDDGKPAWANQVPLPDGAVPSGMGFLSDHRYYVPISTGAVAAVDLEKGQITHVVKSRDGSVPGNLICHRDRVISQGVNGVESYFQTEALGSQVNTRLTANPNDPQALALHGELLLDEDHLEDAITALRRSCQLGQDLRCRDMLRDALLEGLRRNFAFYQSAAPEVERLLDDPQQRAAYLRVMATGLQQTGQWRAALAHLRTMIELDQNPRQLDPLSSALSVRRSRWIQEQLEALRGKGGAESAELVDKFVDQKWATVREQPTPEALRNFLECFGNHPTTEAARRLLVQRLRQSGAFLEAELLLGRQRRSTDPPQKAAAMAEMAALIRDAHRPDDAARIYRLLLQEHPDVPLPTDDGKTPRQLVESWPTDDPVRQQIKQADLWPTGAVEMSKHTAGRPRQQSYGRQLGEYQSGRAPFFSDVAIHFDQAHGTLQARDGLGNPRWQIPLLDPGRGIRTVSYGHSSPYVAAKGHLLIVQADSKIMAVDTIQASSGTSPRILWTHDLADADPALNYRSRVMRLVGRNVLTIDPFGERRDQSSALGPVTDEYVCYQRLRECIAVHPITGETLWVRHGIAPGSLLAGDEQYVLIIEPDQNQALVLSARDGSLLGKRQVPPADQIQTIVGRRFLVVRGPADGSGSLRVECVDPWAKRIVWGPRKFISEAKTEVVGEESLAILEPDGRFVLISLADGRDIIDARLSLPLPSKEPGTEKAAQLATKLGRATMLSGVSVLPLGDTYVVLASYDSTDPTRGPTSQPLPGCPHRPIASGLAFGFDRHGKSIWPAPVKIEQQHIITDQPPALPVVVFGCMVYQRHNNAANQYVTSLLCIDKRTGRVVYRERLPHSTTTFDLTGDSEKAVVELALQPQPLRPMNNIRLQYTDKPWPALDSQREGDSGVEDSDGSEAQPLRSNLLESLWRALQPGARPTRKPEKPAEAQPADKENKPEKKEPAKQE
jgi:outer membrane protein assembly factor BamB/tetratricopeptide (TPR) repeat protein